MNNDLNFRLHHFGISVPSLDETVTWYQQKLGFESDHAYIIQHPQLGARVAFLKLGDFRVEIFEVQGAQPMPESRRLPFTDLGVHGLKHVALAVDDIASARATLQARGVKFLTDVMTVPIALAERYAFFHDNNGVLIELYEPHSPLNTAE